MGQTPNLASVHNRIWFTLRQGGNTSSSLQTAWSACGGDGFVFELLEELDHEELPYVRDARLKERLAYWQLKLDASLI